VTKIFVTLPPGTYNLSPAVREKDRPDDPVQYTLPAVAEHFDLDEACDQARSRIAEWVNRSAGQHLSAMRSRSE
jgi:hypothetical protein